ncbi:unnamed protein product [Sphenostylis stenocarpa]|uniref:Uncharacterized protein n=1 Tax=Sphenostylis stenocarpa TaxID=92480 RepID=A0AA86T3C5_9FABA|nr:unnamed protein product [Sphenostylis stenocarpa]
MSQQGEDCTILWSYGVASRFQLAEGGNNGGGQSKVSIKEKGKACNVSRRWKVSRSGTSRPSLRYVISVCKLISLIVPIKAFETSGLKDFTAN